MFCFCRQNIAKDWCGRHYLLHSSRLSRALTFSPESPPNISIKQKRNLLREAQSIGSCSLFAIILGSRISRELIVHLCVCVLGKIPKKRFFGISLWNLGGWGCVFPNKVQTLQKRQITLKIAFLTRSYQWSIYGMCWITRGPPKSWHCKNCTPLSVGMASIYLMEFFLTISGSKLKSKELWGDGVPFQRKTVSFCTNSYERQCV